VAVSLLISLVIWAKGHGQGIENHPLIQRMVMDG